MGPHKVIAAFKSRGKLIEPPCKWTPPNEVDAARLIKAGCLKEITGSRKGCPRIPTLAEFVNAGVPAPEALGFLAMQQAIADGESAEAAKHAANTAVDAAWKAADAHEAAGDEDPDGDTEPPADTELTGDTEPPADTEPTGAEGPIPDPEKPGLIERAKAAVTGSPAKQKSKGGKDKDKGKGRRGK